MIDKELPASPAMIRKPSLLRRVGRRVRRTRKIDPALEEIAVIEASGMFDKSWYVRHNPDVASSGMDPIQHYVRHGAAEGRDPAENFSTAYYLRSNPDVAASGVNPFRHYIEHGSREGRAARPGIRESRAGSTKPKSGKRDEGTWKRDLDIIAKSSMFDAKFYLKNNPDVAASELEPLAHFCRYGARELRDPSPEFDIAWYWLTYLSADDTSNPLVHYLQSGARDGLGRKGVGTASESEQQLMADIAVDLLRADREFSVSAYTRLGIVLSRLKRRPEAETAYSKALALDWNNAKLHARLATVLAKQGKWWQAVESWSAATNLDPEKANWFFHLGEAQEEMNRFMLAAEAYQRAVELKQGDAIWYYRVGFMWERAGDEKSSRAAYKMAIACDSSTDAEKFGIGVFHQKRGYWAEAAEAYARELERKPVSAELHFRLGMAHDRCYRWTQAEQSYRSAIALKPDAARWHYRYGFVLERQKRFMEAADAYAAGATLSPKPMPFWWYRCGFALAAAGEYKAACRAYLQTRAQPTPVSEGDTRSATSPNSTWLNSYLDTFPCEELLTRALGNDTTDAESHYLLGKVCERRGDWSGAAVEYSAAVRRSNAYCPEWYYRLGTVLFHGERFEEACSAFRDTYLFRLPHGVDPATNAANSALFENMQYREHVQVLPVQRETILYESTHGASIGGNPYAIFEYLLDHPGYCNWTHVWVIGPGAIIPSGLRTRANVILVEHESDLYRRYLATASHLVNDSTFPYWFARRPEQKYLNTWHGTPLKTLGKPILADDEFLSHRNIQRNLLHATHVISPNEHTSDVLMKDFDVCGIFSGKLAETGYPRIDRTLNATPERLAQVRAGLGLDPDRPIALYAPTWRGIFGEAEVDVERLRSDLSKLAELPCQWVFRGHPFSEAGLRDAGLPVAIAPPDIDTADVLAIADLLVTDYSSIFFDFLPTRRPIFFYAYDLEEYRSSRGLYFDFSEMPGPLCRDVQKLAAAIQHWLAKRTDEAATYARAMQRFCPHEDGNATSRVVAFFMTDDDTHVVNRYRDERPSLLFFGGHFAPNGINTSFLNLMHALEDSGKYQITVAVEPLRIKKEPSWLRQFRQLPNGVAVLGRVGRIVQSVEQAWVASKFQQRREFASSAMRDVFREAYQGEFHRNFGNTNFDLLLDFDGYNPYWVMLFALGGGQPCICWLHNDFFEEFVLKHPYLRGLFTVYPDCRSLVSVSEQMARVNSRKLAQRFHISESKFKSCINLIDGQALTRLAESQLDPDLLPWFGRSSKTFLTMGRLSPEKDHAKLIRAFAELVKQCPIAKLVIMGEGVLRLSLDRQIEELGLGSVVYLAGQRSNPFPALVRCDCFVLSSNHEGQPMVLLEALALGRPVIATDIDGNRGVLGGEYGELVDNSVEGLLQGMLRFLEGELNPRPFDADAYRGTAMSQFDTVLGL